MCQCDGHQHPCSNANTSDCILIYYAAQSPHPSPLALTIRMRPVQRHSLATCPGSYASTHSVSWPPPVARDQPGSGRCRPALHQDRTVGDIHVKQVHLQIGLRGEPCEPGGGHKCVEIYKRGVG